ncbi:MAG TPA: Ig-like domain-containing protein [Thermoleophilaceae bacterium]
MPLLAILILLVPLSLAAPAAADEGARGGDVHSASAQREARAALAEARSLLRGRGVETGREPTPALRELAIRMRSLPEGDRRTARRLLARPSQGETQPGEDGYSVPEHSPPLCSAHFCIHWVDSSPDAPSLASTDGDAIPDYVQAMSQVFEEVFAVENVQLGWREPTGDGTRGGDFNKVDVYVKQLGDQGIFGYSTPDPGQETNSQAAYLVMDNDFSHAEYPRYTSFLPPMQVTAAHEYNHVIQFGYDVLQDSWMFESTAVWMEDRVYDDINDYVSYLGPWTQLSQVSLTRFNQSDLTDPLNVKVYGDAVWNRWLDERYGPETIRTAWEKSLETRPPSFAPDAYDAALLAKGTTFFDAFTRFAVDTAEWRSSAGQFEEGPTWPDVQRVPRANMAPGGTGVRGRLDHAAYALANVTPTQDQRVKLVGSLPRDVRGAFALVGLEGAADSGIPPTVVMRRLPRGGQTSIELAAPSRFSRITAVLVNADMTQNGFSQAFGDWDFKYDGQAVAVHVSNDYKRPRVRRRSPGPGAKVSRKAQVVVTFSEAMDNVSSRTLDLLAPGGGQVSARVTYSKSKRQARLVPKRPLRARTRYVVKIGRTIVDMGDNELASSDRTWRFSTRSR